MICIFIGAYFSDLHFKVFICFILTRIDEGRIKAFQTIHNFLLFKKIREIPLIRILIGSIIFSVGEKITGTFLFIRKESFSETYDTM